MKYLIILLCSTLAACAKPSDSTPAAASGSCGEKPFKSKWVHPTYLFVMDLITAESGKSLTVALVVSGGATCTAKMVFTGVECSGTYAVTEAAYAGGGSGDPGCADLNAAGNYTKSDRGLTLANSQTNRTTVWQ